MAFHRIYLIWVLGFIPECHGLCSKPEFINISPQGSSLGVGHTFKTFPTQRVLACMEMCISYPMCRSIDLNREKRECRLQVKSSVTDPGLLVATPNTVHMDKEDFPKILLENACQTLSCDNMTMCKGNTGCVPVLDGTTCGSPPSVYNTTASPAGPFPVGHTHNYTCQVGYDPLHEPYTTCQEDGKWTDVVFLCRLSCKRCDPWASCLSSVCFFYQTHFSDESIGCYVDNGPLVLEFSTSFLVPNGRSHCTTFCSTHGSFKYIGLQSGSYCLCANEIRGSSSQLPPFDCKFYPCQNNPGEWCGGWMSIEIFRNLID